MNVESNFGLYGFTNSIGSQLEKIGDGQEKLLFVNNIYGPTEFSTSYGDTVEINKNLQQDITGITISPKKNFCIIKIWLSKCNFQDASLINCNSGFDAHGCLFKIHAPEY